MNGSTRSGMIRAFVLAAALFVAASAGAETNFECTIDGAQNVPPNAVPGTGFGTFVLNDAETEISYHIEYTGLVGTEIDAHLHNATPRDNGPVVLVLDLGSPKDGVWDVTPQLVTELVEGRVYVNIHTDQYTAGEVRGNIMLEPAEPDTMMPPPEPPPSAPMLEPNYPNPFNPNTTIEYSLAAPTHVLMRIYDVSGKYVRTLLDEMQSPGDETPVVWDGTNEDGRTMPSGVYLLQFDTSTATQTHKMVLLR